MTAAEVALYVLIGCAAASLVLAVVGLGGLVRAGLALQRRVVRLTDQPLIAQVELARARIEIAQQRSDELPVLLERASVALRELEETVRLVRNATLTLAGAGRLLRALWQAGAPR